jgi:hypothetical protein
MTSAQRVRYFRYWQAAWRAHWTGVASGEPCARPDRPESVLRDQIVAIAGQMAGASHLTPDLLRHACHVAALGEDVETLRMTNKQQDLVIAVFQRLAEAGQELAGQIRLDARGREIQRLESIATEASAACGNAVPWEGRRPDADRKRVLWALEHSGYPEAAIATISGDKFGTRAWRGLPDPQLYQLMITVKGRQASRRTPAAPAPRRRSVTPDLVLESNPF